MAAVCAPLALDQIKRIAVSVILVSPALRYYLALHGVDIYSNLFCRLDGLMAGALLAAVVRSERFAPLKHLKMAWVCLLLSVPLAIVAEHRQARWITFSMTSVASACLIYLALFSARKWLQYLFTNRFLVYSGTISYGLYLLHKIPLDITMDTAVKQHPLVTISLTILASYLLAAASWTMLEKPFLKLKRFFEAKPTFRSQPISLSMSVGQD